MKEFQIAIRSFQEVQDFIAMATVQPYKVMVGNDLQLVNAKSFIGMVSLDYSRPLKVLCDCEGEAVLEFERQASRFLAH